MKYILRKVMDRKVLISVLLGAVFGAVLLAVTVSAYSLYTQAINGSGDVSVADDCSTAPCDVHGCRLDKGESWCESTQQCHEAGKYCPPSGGQPTPTPTPSPTPTPTPNPTCVPNKSAGDSCLPSCGANACDGSGPLGCNSCPSSTNAAGENRCYDGTNVDAIINACGGNKVTTPAPTTPSTPTTDPNACDTSNPNNHPKCTTINDGVPGVCSCQKTPGTNICACVGLGNRGTGESCSSNTNCSSGDCDDTLRVCRPAAGSVAKDGVCVDNMDCKSGLVCNNQRCIDSSVADSGNDSLAKTVKTTLICDADLGVCFNEGSEDVAAAIYKNTKTIPSSKDIKDLAGLARNPEKSGSVRFDIIYPTQEDANQIGYGQPCRNGDKYFPVDTFCYLNAASCQSVDADDPSITYCLASDSLKYVQIGGACILNTEGAECASGLGVCTVKNSRSVCRIKQNESVDLSQMTEGQVCTEDASGFQCAQSVEQGRILSCQYVYEDNRAAVRCLPVVGRDGNTAATSVEGANLGISYGEMCVAPDGARNDSCAGVEGECRPYNVRGKVGLVCAPVDSSEQFDYYSVDEVNTKPGMLCTGTRSSSWWCGQNGGVCQVIPASYSGDPLEGLSVCVSRLTGIFNQENVAVGSFCDDRLRGGDAYSCDHGAGVCTVDSTTQSFECKSI